MLPINLGKLQAGLSTTCFGPAKLELFGARKTAIDYSNPKLVVESVRRRRVIVSLALVVILPLLPSISTCFLTILDTDPMSPSAIRPRAQSRVPDTCIRFDLTDEAISMIKIAIESQTSRPDTFMPESSTPSIFAQETSLSQAFTSLTLAPSTSTEQFHSVFRFLHLPAEVRNQIYDLAVNDLPCEIDTGCNKDSPCKNGLECNKELPLNLYKLHVRMPGLGFTCKQMFREVLSIQLSGHESKFCWAGHESGGAFDFSIIQTPMLSQRARRWAKLCAAAGVVISLRHFNFCASFSHGTDPSHKQRLYWNIEASEGVVSVKAAMGSMKVPETTDCMEIWRSNMERGLKEILHQHGTKVLGIAELGAFRLLLQRFSLLSHFRGRNISPQALRSDDPKMIKLKAEYLGCHLETHPWGFYQQTMT
ncbi:hypothetical protein D6D02_04428 [Aureobasidium pullulans]|uniref:Uncharacterized protein n=1 Tax=Aureobasidium pullulans TaxID=5580 RepID=A0A4S8V038_AURPU|nr:hypothetical protein D6D26_02935 [Aureobasidium pullulans]THW14954.1 hypothetical protein D6D24_05210 [Aureobasidium pullulans]THX98954.1 hypothetical protein D6D03_07598 [Aureobasidium pullulans]THY14155.1 hypothetical protein D6D02_04428 [Aureobasidium pullulans]THZ19878.1 hypothetical protein D6C89_07501 [Aureobasidium pullulans]